MKISHSAYAGSETKGDVYVAVSPEDSLSVCIEAKPSIQMLFGEIIEKDARQAALQEEVTGAHILIRDGGGALDFVIRARVRCALRRAK